MSAIETRLTRALRAEFGSFWPGTTPAAALARWAARQPRKTAIVDGSRRLTYAELDALIGRVAAGLAACGVGSGDVVSSQLPNVLESALLCFATNRLGAIHNPIVPIYGAREIRFILAEAHSVVFVAPEPALGRRLQLDLASLRHVLAAEDLPQDDPLVPAAVDPDEVAVILYTSGTTADPKGVLHSSNTLLAECMAQSAYHQMSADEVFVMPSPVGHMSGLMYGVILPIWLGATAVLMERWDPGRFLALVEAERGTFCGGATPFLQGVVEHPDLDRFDLSSFRLFPCGGADVPPALIRAAIRRLGVRTGRGYGSTEFPSITSSAGPDEPEKKRAETDGRPIGPNRVRLDAHGEIWAKGPELCLGYRDASLNSSAFDEAGWFRTGDLGVIDGDGYLTITGRVKDIVVRKGEKISAREIEDLLLEHPKVRSAAIVGLADAEVGERIGVFVVPRRMDDPPALDELCAFLMDKELSRRKLPERLEIVPELPMTAAGKVAKNILRERTHL